MAFPVLTADLAMYFLKLLLERLQRGRAWWLGAPSIFCAGAAVGAVGAAVNAGAVAVVAAIEAAAAAAAEAAAAKQARLAAEAAKVAEEAAAEAAGPEGAMAALEAATAALAAAVEAEAAAAMTAHVPEREVCVINAAPDDLHRWFLPPATSGSFSSLPSSSSGGGPLPVLGAALPPMAHSPAALRGLPGDDELAGAVCRLLTGWRAAWASHSDAAFAAAPPGGRCDCCRSLEAYRLTEADGIAVRWDKLFVRELAYGGAEPAPHERQVGSRVPWPSNRC
jgi:hypothetical protein